MSIYPAARELMAARRIGIINYKEKEVFYVLLKNTMILFYIEEWDKDYCFPRKCRCIEKKDLEKIKKKIREGYNYQDIDFISICFPTIKA